MRIGPSHSGELQGRLLLASPSLLDPNFRRSVIYLASHDTEGSLGFVMNRPSGSLVGDLTTNTELDPLSDVPVYIGGPVGQNQLTIAIISTHPGGGFGFRHNVSALEAAEAAGAPGVWVRAFIGYSGWGEGQLARELQQNSWMIQIPTAETVQAAFEEDGWQRILSGMSPWHKLVAGMPDDPSLN